MDWGDSSSGSEILLVETRKQDKECELHGYFSNFEAVKTWLKKRGVSRVISVQGEKNFLRKFPPSMSFNFNSAPPFAIMTDEQETQAAYVYKMCLINEMTVPA